VLPSKAVEQDAVMKPLWDGQVIRGLANWNTLLAGRALFVSLLVTSWVSRLPAEAAGETTNALLTPGESWPKPAASLTLLPPSPISESIQLDIRAGFRNDLQKALAYQAEFFLDQESPSDLMWTEAIELPGRSARAIRFRWRPAGKAGNHMIILRVACDGQVHRIRQPLVIVASATQSISRLGGAWVDLYHHSEAEGKPFNDDLAKMTDAEWRELVRAMHETEQNLIVITMMFQNYTHRGKHRIDTEGYHGRAYYPSALYPGRMPIASRDPLEAIMLEADRLEMLVMPGVGLYAFSDYGPGSLAWHKRIAEELWTQYGHHSSFYGWYVSEEKWGSLGSPEEQEEIIEFFRQFTAHVRRLAPEKPVMLAPNCFGLRKASEAYRRLLPYVDIICPFGFHRMPQGDISGEQAASMMQSWCGEAGTHLWMDLESFEFRNGKELHPRSIGGLVSDLTRFPNFEKTLHYQFPGLMSSPGMPRQPGGTNAVRLYLDYRKYLSAKVPGAD
jgi:hypothetical protein